MVEPKNLHHDELRSLTILTMSTPSENTSRIAQHLSKFVYEPGRRSPHKSASASIGVIEAVKAEPHPPLVVSSSVPITPSPKRKRDVVPGDHSATKENRTENEIRRSEGNTTLDSSDLSDISESTDRSSKRRRSRQAISSKNKAKKIPRSYADPSVYAHLNLLPDMLKEDLDGSSSQPRSLITHCQQSILTIVVTWCSCLLRYQVSDLGLQFGTSSLMTIPC
jgi:hypothetical protein